MSEYNDKDFIYEKNILEIIMLSQKSLSGPFVKGYSRKRKVPLHPIEEQSLSFLQGYVEGRITITDDSFKTMEEYFGYLRQSSAPAIINILDKAENKFKIAVFLKHKEEFIKERQAESVASPEPEPVPEPKIESSVLPVGVEEAASQKEDKKTVPVVTPRTIPNKELTLNILDKKKSVALLSSRDFLLLAELVQKEQNERIKQRRGNQLLSYIRNKIRLGIENPSTRDEDFEKLVTRFGMPYERESLDKAPKTVHSSSEVITPTPVFSVSDTEETDNRPISDLPPVIKQEDKRQEEEPVVLKVKKTPVYVSEERKEFLSKNNFAILGKKKEMNKLSSFDLLALNEMINDKEIKATAKMKDKIRGFINDRINQTISGNVAADEGFSELVNTLGTHRQKNSKIKPKTDDSLLLEPSADSKAEEKKSSKPGWFARNWESIKRTTKKVVLWAGTTLLLVLGTKAAVDKLSKSSDEPKDKDKTELSVDNANQNDVEVITMEEANEIFGKQPTVQSASVVETKADNKKTDTSDEKSTYEQKYEEYVKSFLAIHKVDGESLINNINQLAKAGKIQFADGTNAAWYAHAFTMYDKVAPNSKENKMIKALMSGQEVSPQEINQLVVNAGRNGIGVKGSGSYSDYDNASKEAQMNYRKVRQGAYRAQMAAKAQQK